MSGALQGGRGGTQNEGPPPTTRCILIIPAHNEAPGIARCLAAAYRSPLPAGYTWREWRVLDDGSSDETATIVRSWSRQRPEPPVKVTTNPKRLGKVATVRACHIQLVQEADLNDIVVFMDADIAVESQTFSALLKCFDDTQVDAATGLSLPARHQLGCLGSAFQIQLSANFARELGETTTRIEGRLYAYRLRAFAKMQLTDGMIVEDTQITGYIAEQKLNVRSAFDAIVRVNPATSYRDFYKQTYRAFHASSLAGPSFPRKVSELTRAARRAVLRTVLNDPAGAFGYLAARLAAAIQNRVNPVNITDQFSQSASTKG